MTRRQGREKLHYLNAVPIRLLHDRWVNKFTAPWVAALSDLKQSLEDRTMQKVFEIYIKTTPRASVAGDHGHRNAAQIYLWRGGDFGLDTGVALPGRRRRHADLSRARIWKSIRRGGWCRASARCGARM